MTEENATKKRRRKAKKRAPKPARSIRRKFIIPIYDVTLWVVVRETALKARQSMNDVFSPYNGDGDALCSRNGWRFGLFFGHGNFTVKTIAHEVFHLTHRILEYVDAPIHEERHEHAALLHEYLFALVLKALKLKLTKA